MNPSFKYYSRWKSASDITAQCIRMSFLKENVSLLSSMRSCVCHFNPCLISVYLHLACQRSLFRKRCYASRVSIPANSITYSPTTLCQLFSFNLKAFHSLYLLFLSLSLPLTPSLSLISSPHPDVNPNLDFQILKGQRSCHVLESGNWGIGSFCVPQRR